MRLFAINSSVLAAATPDIQPESARALQIRSMNLASWGVGYDSQVLCTQLKRLGMNASHCVCPTRRPALALLTRPHPSYLTITSFIDEQPPYKSYFYCHPGRAAELPYLLDRGRASGVILLGCADQLATECTALRVEPGDGPARLYCKEQRICRGADAIRTFQSRQLRVGKGDGRVKIWWVGTKGGDISTGRQIRVTCLSFLGFPNLRKCP
jgi:hypothetical protein